MPLRGMSGGKRSEAEMTAPTTKLDTADECARWLRHSHGVTPRQIRDWARRGRITRHGDLFCAAEIADYLDGRSDADHRRAVIGHLRSGKRTATMSASRAIPESG